MIHIHPSIPCFVASLTLAACATSFTGEAHVVDGRSGCEAKCSGDGMQLAGMVYMGEYSDACICVVPGQSASTATSTVAASGAVAGGASGVIMQMRRQQEQHNHAQY